MFLTYCVWSTVIEKSGVCLICKPVNTKSSCFRLPNGNFCSSFCRASWNAGSPQHKPSSTCMPIRPMVLPCSSASKKTHESNGDWTNPRDCRPRHNSRYQSSGASALPYAPFNSLQVSLSFKPSFLRSSIGGSSPRILSPCSLSRRNAVLTSKEPIVHWFDAAVWRIRLRLSLVNVGLSVSIFVNPGSS